MGTLMALCALSAATVSHGASFIVLGAADSVGSATGVSADGSVVVGYFPTGGTDSVGTRPSGAFRWSGGVAGDYAVLATDQFPAVHGVSGNGQVVVGRNFFTGAPGFMAPVRWVGNGPPESLRTIPGNAALAEGAYGASFDGSVIAAGPAGGWSDVGGLFDIGGFAYDVSADGSVIVGWAPPAGADANFKAIRWTQATGTQVIGPAPDVWRGSVARAVSADGTTIVGSGPGGPWLWTEADGTVFLDDPSDAIAFGEAVDVSGDGSVVVSAGGDAMWFRGVGTRRLSDVLTEQGVAGMGDWMLRTVAISADGRTIVGEARSLLSSSGNYRPFVAQITPVPIPAAALLFGSGVAALAGLRGLRRRTPLQE